MKLRLLDRLVVGLLFVACNQASSPAALDRLGLPGHDVVITDPCNTFASEFAPQRTPKLTHEDGHLTLTVSFTPAEDPKVQEIVAVVSRGRRQLKLMNGKALRPLRAGRGYLALRVDSRIEAEDILKALCFEHGDLLVTD